MVADLRLHPALKAGFNPDQPRDDHGRWTDTGAGTRLTQAEGIRRYSVILSEEEARGGHAIRTHIGKSDEELLATPLADVAHPNQLWCADFRGEFKLQDGPYCYPLTITDQASRAILMCEALQSTREDPAFTAFLRLFEERGLPDAIRTDSGLPFASPNGLYNLSRLSVWWLGLGIALERIAPGRPTQNGRHERMHRTLKAEACRPPAANSLRFDDFVTEFNELRPHEAIAMRTPAEVYKPSARPYTGLPDVAYPTHDRDVLLTACGRICMHRKKINISTVMAGRRLGLKELDDGIRLVTFITYDLGYIDLEQRTLQTIDTPFGTRVLPIA